MKSANPVECECDLELIAERRGPQNRFDRGGISRKNVRKDKIFSISFDGHAIGLFIGAVREQRSPRFSSVAVRNSARVEFVYPVRKRVGVVATRGEFSVSGVPVDLLLRSTYREDCAAILR